MRSFVGAALLLPLAHAFGAGAPLPKLDSPRALEDFFFPADDEKIIDSMKAVFGLDRAGALVTTAANVGPEYATKVAATNPFPAFRAQYALLAKYLELFGPCQKKQQGDREGWWSGYTAYPGEAHCGEATKLVFAGTLWSQVHYCLQLATGEVAPKFGPPPEHGPPYRLDEAPVKTDWLIPDAVYAMTDAAIALRFHETLRLRAADVSREPAERDAILEAAKELERKPVNREIAGLMLLQMMVRSYEAVHLRHLRRLQEKADPSRGK